MNRLFFATLVAAVLATPASGISLFGKHWKGHYVAGNPNAVFVMAARKAGCYICHVKGEVKKDVRNEYGTALSQYLSAEDFPKEWVKANPEEAKRRIIAAFKKVEEDLSKDGQAFGDKISDGLLPAIDSGI